MAKSMLSQGVAAEAFAERELSQERCAKSYITFTLSIDIVHRESAMALERRILPVRVSLITTLASLFPIDLISGSDILNKCRPDVHPSQCACEWRDLNPRSNCVDP